MDIRTLAAELGLSIGTVSRALNDRPDVSEATRARVRSRADALGYLPNHSGRALRSGRTGTVAFVLATSREAHEHGDPFFMGLFGGIQAGLQPHALDLVVLLSRPDEDELGFLRRAVARGVADGWLLSGTGRDDARIAELARRALPFATLGRSRSGGAQPWLDLDFEGAVADAVDRLHALGHRRIALLGSSPERNLSHLVADAFRLAHARHRLVVDERLLRCAAGDEDAGWRGADRMLALDPPPTAFLLNGENLAVGLYRRLRESGLEPGRDVAVIGCRDTPSSRYLVPQLAAYELSTHALGVALAEALLDVLEPERGGAPARTIWPLRFRPGDSLAALPAQAPGRRAR